MEQMVIAGFAACNSWPFIRSTGQSTSVTRIRGAAKQCGKALPRLRYSQGSKYTQHLKLHSPNGARCSHTAQQNETGSSTSPHLLQICNRVIASTSGKVQFYRPFESWTKA